MRLVYLVSILLALSTFSCDSKSQSQTGPIGNDPSLSAIDEQIERHNVQLDITDQQLSKAAAQAERYDALLKRWEEQADRIDALIDCYAELCGRLAGSSNQRAGQDHYYREW